MWLVVGLGNPGGKYERTRHNIGFRVVDALLAKHGLPEARSSKYKADIAQGNLKLPSAPASDGKIVVCKPMEFMNLSGFAVQRVAGFHHITIPNIVVVHDEIDLDFGLVRLKSGGGHGGHNGLRSMIDQLGNNGFARVRVGVGKPAHHGANERTLGAGHRAGSADGGAKAAAAAGNLAAAGAAGKDVAGWVLSDFPSAQAAAVDRIIAASIVAVETIVSRGIAPAMNACNSLKSLA